MARQWFGCLGIAARVAIALTAGVGAGLLATEIAVAEGPAGIAGLAFWLGFLTAWGPFDRRRAVRKALADAANAIDAVDVYPLEGLAALTYRQGLDDAARIVRARGEGGS